MREGTKAIIVCNLQAACEECLGSEGKHDAVAGGHGSRPVFADIWSV